MNDQQKQLNASILETIICSVILLENLDVVKHSFFYEKGLKKSLNDILPHLERSVNRGAEMLMGNDKDFKGFYCLQDDAKKFIRKMSLLTPGQKSMFNEVTGLIQERGDWVINQLGLQVIESNQVEEWTERQRVMDDLNALDFDKFKEVTQIVSLLKNAPLPVVNSLLITAKSMNR